MSSPEKGYMFDIRPKRVSLVKRPANRRRFLVTKSEEELVMDEIIQIITKTEAENEEVLVESLKSEGKDEGTIQAALSVYRTLSAFRDSLSDNDFGAIAKALEVKTEADIEAEAGEENIVKDEEEVEKTEEEDADDAAESVEKTEEEVETTEEEVTKDESDSESNDELAELKKEIALLKASTREKELRAMISGVRIGKSEDELYDILKAQDEKGADISQIVDSWKVASTAVESALTEIGSDLPGVLNKDGGDRLTAEAERIASEKGISVAEAWKHVPTDLVRQYYDE